MALLTPISALFRRSCFSIENPLIQFCFSSLLLLKIRPFDFCSRKRLFSSSPHPLQPDQPDPKTTLSSRISFVFDQIDAIDCKKWGKDEALQSIRSCGEQKRKNKPEASVLGLGFPGSIESASGLPEKKEGSGFATMEVELVHPWPEWIELMEILVRQNYFDHRRKDEDRMVPDTPPDDDVAGLGFVEEGFDFTRDWTTVRNVCLNFGRDRFDILRSLSRNDIQTLVGHGCPSADTKVIFSAKVLRKHVHLDEGDVCSSCNLRSSCNRAYLLTCKEDEARTVDIMRVLLTFGFEPLIGSVENKPLLKLKSVKTVVRKLLHEVVKLSALPIDPNLPPPVIKKTPPKVKQPPPPPKKRVGRDAIEMKKGDWLCPKCDFMNFAKNTVCLQCDTKRPKRQLLPGEWECPECNFLNYRRNMVCFHCEKNRPPDEFIENQILAKPHGPRTRLDRVSNSSGISNAWSFDYDDNESDSADVAAFEFADPPRMGEDSFSHGQTYRANSRGSEEDLSENIRKHQFHERERYSASYRMVPSLSANGTGFDDFDDEDDDVDNYELDVPEQGRYSASYLMKPPSLAKGTKFDDFDDVDNYELDVPNKDLKETSKTNFSEVGGFSESEDFDNSDNYSDTHQGTSLLAYDNLPHPVQGRTAFSGSDYDGQEIDSDNELSAHLHLKSSYHADSKHRGRGRGGSGPHKALSFGSDFDDELGLNSDSADGQNDMRLRSKWNKERKYTSDRMDPRKGNSDSDDVLLFGSESDDSDVTRSWRNMRGNKAGPKRRGNTFRGRDWSSSERGSGIRNKSFVNNDRSFDNSHRNGRESKEKPVLGGIEW